MSFLTECPACDEELEITDQDLRRAEKHKGETGGMLLKGCPHCCRVMVIDGEMLARLQIESEEADAAGNPSWLPCLEMEGVVAKMPTGFEEHMNIREYRPGGGGAPMERWPYMATYGVDPVCALEQAGR